MSQTISTLLQVKARPHRASLLARVPHPGLDPLRRHVSGRREVVRAAASHRRLGPPSTRGQANGNANAHQQQCSNT